MCEKFPRAGVKNFPASATPTPQGKPDRLPDARQANCSAMCEKFPSASEKKISGVSDANTPRHARKNFTAHATKKFPAHSKKNTHHVPQSRAKPRLRLFLTQALLLESGCLQQQTTPNSKYVDCGPRSKGTLVVSRGALVASRVKRHPDTFFFKHNKKQNKISPKIDQARINLYTQTFRPK